MNAFKVIFRYDKSAIPVTGATSYETSETGKITLAPTSKISKYDTICLIVPTLGLGSDALTWKYDEVEKVLKPINNIITEIEEIYSFANYTLMFSDYSDWKRQTMSNAFKVAATSTVGEHTISLVPKIDETKTVLEFSFTVNNSPVPFAFRNMSHRARLVTGFYDFDFSHPNNEELKLAQPSPSAPLPHFGNLLYLVSNNGNVIHSTNCQNPSVIYRIQTPLSANMPILIKPLKEERDEVIADGTSLRNLKLTLTDRWLEPVKIKCPLVVTIKMQPIKEDVPTYG
jgi:hypothetical protein